MEQGASVKLSFMVVVLLTFASFLSPFIAEARQKHVHNSNHRHSRVKSSPSPPPSLTPTTAPNAGVPPFSPPPTDDDIITPPPPTDGVVIEHTYTMSPPPTDDDIITSPPPTDGVIIEHTYTMSPPHTDDIVTPPPSSGPYVVAPPPTDGDVITPPPSTDEYSTPWAPSPFYWQGIGIPAPVPPSVPAYKPHGCHYPCADSNDCDWPCTACCWNNTCCYDWPELPYE